MECRIVLSAVPLTLTLGNVPSDVTLRVQGETGESVQIVDTRSGSVLASRRLAETSEVVVVGSEQTDTLRVDFARPFFLPITFAGGDGPGFDSLVLAGGRFDSAAYLTLGPDSGTIALAAGTATSLITYRGLEPIIDNTGGAKTFEGTDDREEPDVITVTDTGSAGDNSFTIKISIGEDVTYTNASAITSLTINAGEGDDEIVLDALDTLFQGSLTINAGEGDDQIAVHAKSSSGSYTIHGDDDSGEDGDTLILTRDANFTLTDTLLAAGSESYILADVEVVQLTGGVSANTFDVSGFTGNTELSGLGGADIFISGAGDDAMDGGSGNDTYRFIGTELGFDSIVEAEDIDTDTLDFSLFTAVGGINLDLAAANQVVNEGDLTLEISDAAGIENVIGTAQWDQITGNSRDNVLTGGPGSDTYYFALDAVSLAPGVAETLGQDTIVEAADVDDYDALDFAAFAPTSGGITLDLSLTSRQMVKAGTPNVLALTLSSGSGIEYVQGTSRSDNIKGNARANRLSGSAGNDTLEGGAGNDTLIGGPGDERYVFAADVALGSDQIVEIEEGGSDTVDFSATSGGVNVNLSLFTSQVVNANLSLDLSDFDGVEVENAVGGSGDDNLTGNTAANILEGGAGSDGLAGGFGDDTYRFDLDVPLGADNIFEGVGGGADTLDFSATSAGVTATLADAAVVSSANLTLIIAGHEEIERVSGGSGNDTLAGNSANNVLEGGPGNDILSGGLGNDAYRFHIDHSLGSDMVHEAAGGGTDTLDFSFSSVNVEANLGNATVVSTANLTLTLGLDGEVENLVGGSGHDIFTGNSLNNTLTGGLGDDIYRFDIDGPLGSDSVVEAAGGGSDTLDFSASSAGVTANLGNATVVSTVQLTLLAGVEVENLIGGSNNDILTGSSANNMLEGGAGNDTLIGGPGDDTYRFDVDDLLGSDSIVEAANGGSDTLDFSASTVAVTVDISSTTAQTVHATNLTLMLSAIEIENVSGGSGDDTIIGNLLDNTLTGGPGNDTLTGGAGFDTYVADANGGTDTITDNELALSGTENDDDYVLEDYDRLDSLGSEGKLIFRTADYSTNTIFVSPEEGLTIDLGDGNDTLTINALDPAFQADLIIDSGAGEDESVTIAGNITNPGHLLEIDAETITVNANVMISTRNFDGTSFTGDSGDITFLSVAIAVEDGAQLLADSGDGFQGGDISFTTLGQVEFDWATVAPAFKDKQANASIDIGAATLRAGSIFLVSTATTSKFAEYDISEGGVAGALTGQALAAVEADPTVTLQFRAGTDLDARPTISRSSGSWVADGFVAGMVIKVIGSDFNDGSGTDPNDLHTYTVDQVTNNVLTLIETDTLVDETKANVAVRQALTSILPEDLAVDSVDPNDVQKSTTLTQEDVVNTLKHNISLLDFIVPANVVFSHATSGITIGSGANLWAAANVGIESEAISDVNLSGAGLGLIIGVVYTESYATATAAVERNATITAGEEFSLRAEVTNEMNASVSASSGLIVPMKPGGQTVRGRTVTTQDLKVPGPAITFAYGKARSDVQTRVEDGAAITAGSAVVSAIADNDFDVSAKSKIKFPRTNQGQAVGIAISDNESTATATVEGDITTTTAGSDPETAGDVQILADSTNVNNDTVATAKVSNKVPGARGKISNSKLAGAENRLDLRSKPGKLGISAGVAIAASVNNAVAQVGASSRISAQGGTKIDAHAEDNFQATAIGTAKAGAEVAIAGAVAVGNYRNTASAAIGDGAVLDAKGAVEVTAKAWIPDQVTVDEAWNNFINSMEAIGNVQGPGLTPPGPDATDEEVGLFYEAVDTYTTGLGILLNGIGDIAGVLGPTLGVDTLIATSFVGAGAEAGSKEYGDKGRFAISASVDILDMVNTATAVIGEAARINQSAGFDQAASLAGQSVTVHADAVIETINIGGIPGITGVVGSTKSEGSSVGGTYGQISYDNSAIAYIDDGSLVSAGDDVSVTAHAENFLINVMEAGGGAKKIGISGVFALNQLENTSLSYVEESATVVAGGDVMVEASTEIFAVLVTPTIMLSEGIGVGVVVVVNEVANETRALIGDSNSPGLALATPAGLSLSFVDNGAAPDTISRTTGSWKDEGFAPGQMIRVSGAGANDGDYRIATISADGQTVTLAAADGLAPLGPTTAAQVAVVGRVVAGGDVNVDAAVTEDLYAIGIAAAVSTGSSEPDPMPTGEDDAALDGVSVPALFGEEPSSVKQKSGIGISGDVAINDINDTVEASISGGVAIRAGGVVDVHAENDAFFLSVAGAFAVEASAGAGGSAIAGSFTLNEIDRDVLAFVEDATVDAGSLSVNAENFNKLLSVTAGAAGAVRDGTAAVAGSVNVNLLVGNTGAWADAAIDAGDVQIAAHDDLTVISVAGSVSVTQGSSSRFGFGAAVDVGEFDRTVAAWIGAHSVLDASAGVSVEALSTVDLISVAASVRATISKSQGLGLLGSVTSQNFATDVEAFVASGAVLTAENSLTIHADDTNEMIVIAGALGFGGGSGVGASLANIDHDDRVVHAYLGDATVTVLGKSGTILGTGVVIDAAASDDVVILAAGGNVSTSKDSLASAAASIVAVTMDGDVQAYVAAGASVNQETAAYDSDQSVIVRAAHETDIIAVAGAFGIGGKVGIGAAAVGLDLDKTVLAYLGGAAGGSATAVSAEKNVEVRATSSESILGIAGALAFTTSGVVGAAGSAVVIPLTSETKAWIGDGATVSADGNVVVAADSDLETLTVAGSIEIGGKVGVGVSASTITHADDTAAWIGAATVDARGNGGTSLVFTGTKADNGNKEETEITGVFVGATSFEDLWTVAAGGSGSKNVGVAAMAVVNVLDETTTATLAENARINLAAAGEDASQSVAVLASDNTTIFSVAGAIAYGGTVGVGAGVDVDAVTKKTQARIRSGASVEAQGDVTVQAYTSEDVTSSSVAGAGSLGTAGVAGAVGVSTFSITAEA